MADELKTFRVTFKDGKSITVKAHHFNPDTGVFFKSERDPDTDIWVRMGEVSAIVPEAEDAGVAAGNVSRSSSGVHIR
jgi:hypothetical protein